MGAIALAVQIPAAAETLASWTFETGYEVTDLGDKKTLYTPDASLAPEDITKWFNESVPVILPEEANGNASDYTLSAYCEPRYWSLTNGYQTRVLRIENATAPNVTTDFTNPENHKAYYELTFPTKGYKDVTITYAIAPGNNTETPVEMVVSTDGGQTWFDSGSKNTSPVWFQYTDQTVALSVNNKEQVKVRLLPTEGETNWNLRNISVSAEKGDIPESMDIKGATLTWELHNGSDSATAGVSSAEGVYSVAEMSIGSNLTLLSGIRTDGGNAISQFQPIEGNNGENNNANAITFTITPKAGLTLTPKAWEFDACRVGTNGGKFSCSATVDGKETFLLEDQTPQLVKEAPYVGHYSIDLSKLGEITSTLELRIYIKGLANNKQYGYQNVVFTADITGELIAVPSYTFSLNSAMEGAGALSCSPAGAEFDEGTLLTVSSTENFGYHFSYWSDAEGNKVSTDNPYSFKITADTKLTANYEKNNVYALNLDLQGGANVNLVQYTPEGHVADGVHYYEEGTDVRLTTYNNRILTFTNWEDNSTSPTRDITMDGDKNVTANFAACDYIVGWDLYYDQPASERAADYKDETDNAGLLSLRNAAGNTTSWLTRGVGNGAENGKWGARIWKLLSDQNYFEISFSTIGYTDITVAAALGIQYNSYSKNEMQYSTDGSEFTTVATYELTSGWTSKEVALPADASNAQRVWVRFMPDRSSKLVGNSSDYDGLAIAEVFVLANKEAAEDNTAPQALSIIPANGEEGASATGSVIVNFDEKITVGSGDATLNGERLTPRISGKSVVYNYAGLDYGTTYTFTLPAGAITDRSGNPCAELTSTFTTMERIRPAARTFDAIVAADGTGDFPTVQAAIDAAPEGRINPWLIFVKNGSYNEHIDIPASKPMLHIIGQDRDKTVILDNKLCGGANALHVSVGATAVVKSDDCFFENITIENSWGHDKQDGPQALALNTMGDRTILNNVALLSYQDTWITPSTSNYRAYVHNSFIEGAVDFIYNSGNIYIDNTTLYIIRKSGGYIVAPSHGADVEWGYVFNNCTITAPGVPSETTVWLGRPWHNAPKTVFLNTRAEVTIPATGWYETMGGLPALWADWNTTDANGNLLDLSQRRDTYYYTDSEGKRVYGKAKNFLTDEEAAEYTVKNVLTGSDNWQPTIKTESCAAPTASLLNGTIEWKPVDYAICYVVTRNDEVVDITTETCITTDANTPEGYFVQAVNEFGGLSAKAAVEYGSTTGVKTADKDNIVEGIYNINGMRISAPTKGVNIIRLSNGSIQKMIKR